MRVLALAAVLSILFLACAPASPSPAASVEQPATHGPTIPATPSPVPSPSVDVSHAPSPPPDPIGDVQCAGGATSGSSDYVAGVGGGLPDVEQATRALQGVLPSDDVVVDAERSAVRRDGRVIFIGWWFESSAGGWLLSTFVNCGDSGIGID